MKLPYTPAGFTLLPRPSSLLQAAMGEEIAAFCCLPEEPGSSSRVFAWDVFGASERQRPGRERGPRAAQDELAAAEENQFLL